MKLRNVTYWTGIILTLGLPVSVAVREEIPMPLAWYNPILAKYDKNSDEILSGKEASDLIRGEMDSPLSKEEYKAYLKAFFSNRGFLPLPKNISESFDNYNNAIRTKILIDSLNRHLEEENKKQWVPVEVETI